MNEFPGTAEQPGAQAGEPAGHGPSGSIPPLVPPRKRRVVLRVVLGIACALLLIGAGIAAERVLLRKDTVPEPIDFNLSDSRVFQEALDNIEQFYYREVSPEELENAAWKAVEEALAEGESDTGELEEAAIRGMTQYLDDPHSVYLNPEENQRLKEDISGTFFGVGFMLRVNEERERPYVFNVIGDSPSDRAGVRRDDLIISVDGEDTLGQSLDLVVSRIRGEKGTTVELVMEREGEPEELVFEIEREKIDIPELETEIMDGRYGYLDVFNFNRGIGGRIREAVREMAAAGVQGFVLDLRNNPGGLLEEAVNVASVFLDEGEVVSYQVKGENKVDEPARGGAESDLPLVILVNGGSASSSEITAGALQDYGRGVLIGDSTYGKGSVQKIYQLSNGGALKLTISLYLLPDGEAIEGVGLIPDIKVEYPEDPVREEELQTEKAIEVLEELIQGRYPSGLLMLRAA